VDVGSAGKSVYFHESPPVAQVPWTKAEAAHYITIA
jgi:hypothetical protein